MLRHFEIKLEAETAVTLSPPPDRNPVRCLIAKNLEKLALNCKQKMTSHKPPYAEKRITNKIKEKLQQNNAIVTKANKGNSIIITDKVEYESKIMQFLTSNQFQTIPKNPTKKF
jgi:hypothetical protein